MNTRMGAVGVLVGTMALGGCGDGGIFDTAESDFTSAEATLMDFEFDGQLLATSRYNPRAKIQAQLIYTVGHLNQERSVSRLNAVELSDIETSSVGGGLYRIRYHARLPVAWGDKDHLPSQYTLTLPMRVDSAGQSDFQSVYGATCTDHGSHQLTSANFWYYYRPGEPECFFADGDVNVSVAQVTKSADNSVDAYPEYHRIWEDGVLDVVAVFGKNDRGATSNEDAGISAYNSFIAAIRDRFPEAATTPLEVPTDPGNDVPDITFEVETYAGRVNIVALLVDEVKSAPESFDDRFSEATPRADLVLYGGHAGLGTNVRALTAKAEWFPNKYQILFLNGCDTFAYESDALVEARAELNPDDPDGTRHMDVMHNAMPAYFHRLAPAALAVIDAALDVDAPRSYEEIFERIDPKQVVLVTGDEDNVYRPEQPIWPRWQLLEESGSLRKDETDSYQTEVLPAGRYLFELTPEPSMPGGDADLFLRVGEEPSTTSAYKCQSYLWNTNERCFVTLDEPAKVYLKTQGDKWGDSPYILRAWEDWPEIGDR